MPAKSLRESAAALGRRGGRARAKAMTAAERRKSAQVAANARWAKRKRTPKERERLAEGAESV